MIRKIAIYFASLLGVFLVLALLDPDGFMFDPRRALIALLLLVLGAFALWVRYDWAKGEDREEP